MTRGEKSYYQILGVRPEASIQEIKECYRRLAFQFHPDRNKENPTALERMKEINEAYAVLSDPEKRAAYDRARQQYGAFGYERFRDRYSEEDIFRGTDIHQIFAEMSRAFGFRGFDEIFRECNGPGFRSFEFRRPGILGRGFIFFGPTIRRSHSSLGRIDETRRPGYGARLGQYLLKRLLGIREPQRGQDLVEMLHLDASIARDGGKIHYHHWRRGRELVVTIPSGIREGQKIRLRGMGLEGKEGGEAGDLYLEVKIKKSWIQRIGEFMKRWIRRA